MRRLAAAGACLQLTMAAAAADFTGSWMITIDAPGVAPYVGQLDIEETAGELRAWVENGPVPIKISGDRIEVTVSLPSTIPVRSLLSDRNRTWPERSIS